VFGDGAGGDLNLENICSEAFSVFRKQYLLNNALWYMEKRSMLKIQGSRVILPLVLIGILALTSSVTSAANTITEENQILSLTSLEEQVVALANGSRAYDYDLQLENISYGHYAFRSGGSAGANETANWIKAQFESFGLETYLEPFSFTTWDVLDKPSFLIDDDGNQNTTGDQTVISPFQCEHYSWPTLEDGVFADLVILPLPYAADGSEIGLRPINMTAWNAVDTTGKIVLIGREVRMSSNWHQTYVNKLSAQSPAAVVYTWWYDWMSFVPDFFNSAGGRPLGGYGPYYWNLHVPLGFVNYEDGLWIRNRENATNVFGHVSVRAVIGTGTHYNVIGKISGYKNPEKQVIISGHYDTVMCSGFCDNGAGTAGVIELANVFSGIFNEGIYKPRYTLLFIAFASEEIGLVGSINYIRQHKSEMPNITAVINLDGIGSNDFVVTPTDPANGFDLDEIIFDAAEDLGITAALETPGASDHESFRDPSWANYIYNLNWGLEAGISDAAPVKSSSLLISRPLFYHETPSGWIHTSYDNSTSTETLEWVEAEDLENHIKVVALTVVRVSPTLYPFDIAILNVKASKTVVGQGYSLSFNVTVENQGMYTETFNVTLYANTTILETFTNVTLTSGNFTVLALVWNTGGLAKDNYSISAYASPLPDETDTVDNTYTNGVVTIAMVGDLNADGSVDIFDIVIVATEFGRPPPPITNSNADINNDGIIDLFDLVIVAAHFGQVDP